LPVIIAAQEAEIRRIGVQSQPRQNSLQDPYLEKTQHTIKEMVEWLKVVPELKPQYHKKKKKKKSVPEKKYDCHIVVDFY
jgi:hypothetical protein